MPIWEPEKECMDREELRQLQLERLQATLNRVYRNVAFYRRQFDEAGFRPDEHLVELADLERLPFTTAQDVSDGYPYQMFAVSLREVVRVHSSSGTSANPRVVGYTRQDLRAWSNLVARILSAAGITKDDVVQVTFAYGLMTGGLGIHYGVEHLGASVLPTSVGRTERQVQIMKDYRTTALICTPSYALTVADAIGKMGLDPKELSLRICICAGERWDEPIRKEIEDRLLVKAMDNYGATDVMGPGLAGECEQQNGMHVQEDHFLMEIIDPATGKVLPPGETGELVITTLAKEAFPMVRYRTGDLCRIIEEPCACGRTFRRIGKIRGRCDDVVVIKGINIIPERIGDILEKLEGERPVYKLVATRQGHHDELEIHIGVDERMFFDRMRDQRGLVDVIRRKVANFIGITPRIRLVEVASLREPDGSVKLFEDLR